MKAQLRWMAISAVVATLAGCSIEPPESTVFPSVVNNGMEDQGRFLLGTVLDFWSGAATDEHFSVSTKGVTATGAPVELSIPSAALLTATRPLQSLVVTGGPPGAPVRLRVSLVAQLPPFQPTMTKVRLERQDGDAWIEGPCGSGLAIALAGVFQRDGLHVARADRLTFACDGDGVAAKCADWGYPAGRSPGSLIWDTHQACTRMARADICANGQPHTRRETRIWFYDIVQDNGIPDATTALVQQPLDTWPPPPDIYYFEAMWRAGSQRAGCLSKLRWQALRVGALCNGLLPDPRSSSNSDGLVDSCEATSVEDAIANGGAILFNKTQYSDLALVLWKALLSDGTYDYTTTVRGFIGGGSEETVHPFHEAVGALYHPEYPEAFLMRVPPAGLAESEYAAVSTFVNGRGERVLARRDDPAFGAGSGYTREHDEGYVLNASREGARAELWLWRNPGTGDRVALTGSGPPAAGYGRERRIGFLTDPDRL